MVRKERQSVVKRKRAGCIRGIADISRYQSVNKHKRSIWLSKTSEKIEGVDVKTSSVHRVN